VALTQVSLQREIMVMAYCMSISTKGIADEFFSMFLYLAVLMQKVSKELLDQLASGNLQLLPLDTQAPSTVRIFSCNSVNRRVFPELFHTIGCQQPSLVEVFVGVSLR